MSFKVSSDLLPCIAIIPARAGSKGVPGKNLRILGGKTLLERAVECANLSGIFSRVIVSSDGPELLAAAERLGVRAIARPVECALDDSNIIDAIAHVLSVLVQEGMTPAAVVLLEPSCPLRTPAMVLDCVNFLAKHDAVFTVTEVDLKFHPAKQFRLSEAGLAQRACPSLTAPVNRQELSPTVIRNGAVYAFRAAMFHREKSVLGQAPMGVIIRERLVNIDTVEDFIHAEQILAGKN